MTDTDRNIECAKALGYRFGTSESDPEMLWRPEGMPVRLPDFSGDGAWVLWTMHKYNLSVQCDSNADGDVEYRAFNSWDNEEHGGEIGIPMPNIGESVREWVIAFAAAGGGK